jgi:hypothetical protein
LSAEKVARIFSSHVYEAHEWILFKLSSEMSTAQKDDHVLNYLDNDLSG